MYSNRIAPLAASHVGLFYLPCPIKKGCQAYMGKCGHCDNFANNLLHNVPTYDELANGNRW